MIVKVEIGNGDEDRGGEVRGMESKKGEGEIYLLAPHCILDFS